MDIVVFALLRLFTKAFWAMVFVTLVGIVMMSAKGFFRNQIFEAASGTVGKRFGP